MVIWPWPWIFKVKFWKCFISGIGGLIDMGRKGCELIGCYTHFVTFNLDLNHDLDQGCTKLKSAWGLNFKKNFLPDFHAILCCLVRPKMFMLFLVIYIYIYIYRPKKMNNNNMNKKIIFWWSLWTMALIWDEFWMPVSALINYKVPTAKQFKSWKKGTRSRMLIEKENSSHKQLMSNFICCNSCWKVGSHIVYVLLSKILIISFWRKHAYTAR